MSPVKILQKRGQDKSRKVRRGWGKNFTRHLKGLSQGAILLPTLRICLSPGNGDDFRAFIRLS